MKASIVIPAFNEEKYIKPTLEALLAQDHKDLEIIVIDNNSTDNTAGVAREMGVTVIHEHRKGTMWACEAGRKIATGDVIIRVDADCIAEIDFVSNGLKHFENEKVVALSGPYDYHDSEKIFRFISGFIQQRIYPITNFVFQTFGLGAVMIGGNTFLRATTIEKIGGFATHIVFYGDDSDTAKRMSEHGKVVFNPKHIVKSSARRFKAHGNFNILKEYLKGFLQFTVLNPNKKKK